MRNARLLVMAGAVLAVAFGLSGCGERPQVISYEQGKYQGKPDMQPWNNDPSASIHTSSNWTKGDKGSWERAIKARTENQNDYIRIGG